MTNQQKGEGMAMDKEYKVTSNATGLGLAKGMLVIDELDVGYYQGQTVAFLDDIEYDTVHIYIVRYGSCGGCDWFYDFYGKEPTYKGCLDAWQDEKPRYIFPKSKLPTARELFELLYEKDSGYQGMNPDYGWTEENAAKMLAKVN